MRYDLWTRLVFYRDMCFVITALGIHVKRFPLQMHYILGDSFITIQCDYNFRNEYCFNGFLCQHVSMRKFSLHFFFKAAYNCHFQFTILLTICHSLDKQFGIKYFTWVAHAGRCICGMGNRNLGERYWTWMRNKYFTLIIAIYQLVSPLMIIYGYHIFYHSCVSNFNFSQWWCPKITKYLHVNKTKYLRV